MSLTAIKKEYATLQSQINELHMQMREKSKDLMKAVFADFFEKYDSIVKGLFWHQYTPYFNDGESCEFSVHDVWITLHGNEDEDGDFTDEGSTVYGADEIVGLKARIIKWEEFNRDPKTAVTHYREDYIKRYKRDPFGQDRSWRSESPEEQMAKWKPDYTSLEALQAELVLAEKIIADYPNLKKDHNEVATMIAGIDEDLMKAMFGDHTKVICTKDGIETEDYDHD